MNQRRAVPCLASLSTNLSCRTERKTLPDADLERHRSQTLPSQPAEGRSSSGFCRGESGPSGTGTSPRASFNQAYGNSRTREDGQGLFCTSGLPFRWVWRLAMAAARERKKSRADAEMTRWWVSSSGREGGTATVRIDYAQKRQLVDCCVAIDWSFASERLLTGEPSSPCGGPRNPGEQRSDPNDDNDEITGELCVA